MVNNYLTRAVYQHGGNYRGCRDTTYAAHGWAAISAPGYAPSRIAANDRPRPAVGYVARSVGRCLNETTWIAPSTWPMKGG